MKKNLLLFTVSLFLCFLGKAETVPVFYDSFEDYDDFQNSNVGKWITIDKDGLECYGFMNTTLGTNPGFNVSPVLNSFLVFNSANYTPPDPTSYTPDYAAHTGDKVMVAITTLVIGQNVDDWLISPEIDLGSSNYIVNFWVKAGYKSANAEKFNVLITTDKLDSAKDFNADAFESISGGTVYLQNYISRNVSTEWVQVAFPIDEKYKNETVRIAINNVASGGASGGAMYFIVDDFQVIEEGCIATVDNIKITDITTSTVNVSWTSDNATKYEIEYGKTGFTRGKSGEANILYTNDTEIVLEGLEDYTNYEVYVTPYCSENEKSLINGKIATFKTDIYVEPVTITPQESYYYGFESEELIVDGWKISTPDEESGRWNLVYSTVPGGSETKAYENFGFLDFLHSTDVEPNPSNSWAISRGFNLTAGQEIVVYFYMFTGSDPKGENLRVKIANEDTAEALMEGEELLDLFEEYNNLSYKRYEITYKAEADGTYYLGFQSYSTTRSGWGVLRLDNINIVDARAYIKEEYTELINETFDSYSNLAEEFDNWQTSHKEGVNKITIEGISVEQQDFGFIVLDSEELNGVDENKYDFTSFSENNSLVTFAAQDGASDDWLITENIELGKIGNVISFWAKSPVKDANNEKFQIWVSVIEDETDALSDFKPVTDVINLKEYVQENYETNWVKFAYSLDEYVNKKVQVAIRYTGSANENATALMIDNIKVVKGGSLHTISSAYTSSLEATTTYINWYAELSTSYEVEYGEKGFQLGKGINITTQNKGTYLEDLLPNTVYQYYIRSYVDEGVPSEIWAGPFEFRTEIETIYPEDGYSYGFENGDYVEEGWRATDSEGNTAWKVVTDDEENATEGSAYLLYHVESSEIYYKDYLFTRPIEIKENENIYISFKYKTSTSVARPNLIISFDSDNSFGINAPFATIQNVTNTEYETYEISQGFYAGVYYFAFNVETQYENAEVKVFIDDVFFKVVSNVGIEDSTAEDLVFNVYPNPAQDILNIVLPANFNEVNTKVMVTDMTGRRVKVENYTSSLPLYDLPAGIYTIAVTDGIEKQNKVFIKK